MLKFVIFINKVCINSDILSFIRCFLAINGNVDITLRLKDKIYSPLLLLLIGLIVIVGFIGGVHLGVGKCCCIH
jgi:hypothetical protein